MDIKKILLQYNDLKKERDDIERRLNNLKKRSEIVSDTVQSGIKRYIAIVGYDVKRGLLIDKYEELLRKACLKIDELKIEVEEFIQTLEDSSLRQIFRYRYIDEKNWIQIMHLMKYSSEDKARKKHDRFLEKF